MVVFQGNKKHCFLTTTLVPFAIIAFVAKVMQKGSQILGNLIDKIHETNLVLEQKHMNI
jgi:hypothetical protein